MNLDIFLFQHPASWGGKELRAFEMMPVQQGIPCEQAQFDLK
jgi:hypothetical protein